MKRGAGHDLIFLKLGGSLLTDKTRRGSFRTEAVRRLGREIRQALEARPTLRLIIAHGGGSLAHFPAKKYRTREGLSGGGGWKGFAETRRGVIEMNRSVLKAFADVDFRPILVSPCAEVVTQNGRVRRWGLSVIQQLLESGQTPMIHGDCVLDRALGFTILSTEELFAHLAMKLRPMAMLLACDVEGVYPGDPTAKPRPKVLHRVNSSNLTTVRRALRAPAACDVTGGMASKVEHLHRLTARLPKLTVRIFSGLKKGCVKSVLLGGAEGTLIAK